MGGMATPLRPLRRDGWARYRTALPANPQLPRHAGHRKKKDDRELSRLHHRVGTRTKYFWSPRSGKTRSNSIKGSPAKQSRRARENSRKTRNPRRNFVEDYTDVLTDKNKTHSMSGLRCRRRQLERKQNWICRHYLARRYTHKKTILRNHIVFICVVKSSET